MTGAGAGGFAFASLLAFRATAGTALLGVVLLSVLCGARELREHRRLLFPYAGGTLLLTLYLALVAPVLTVGLFFGVPGSVEGSGPLLVLVSSLTLPHAAVVSRVPGRVYRVVGGVRSVITRMQTLREARCHSESKET